MIAALEGKTPVIAESAFVAPNATVVGEVTLAEHSSVWYSAVIRGDLAAISVGEGTSIQDNVTLHGDTGHPITIGCDVSVGHNAVIHGATIGDATLVGMGAVILNGAVIGEGCIIGAGAMVAGGAHFPSHSLIVGCPAKAISQLHPVQVEENRKNAAIYRELALQHKALIK